MRRSLVLAVVVACVFALDLSAQATRTWVSGVGDDVNPCSRTAPCKTWAGAISKTAAGGEMNAIDSGGYGAVTITKSITIDGGGVLAGTLASGTNGIIINAAATDVVNLRRLSINGAGTGFDGIRVLLAKQVNITDVQIFGFTSDGIEVAATMTAGNVRVARSTIENANVGISVLAGNVIVTSTEIANQTVAGIDANGNASSVMVSNSTLTMNGRGIRSANGARVRISHNDILFNAVYAWEITGGGVIETHVDNRTRGTSIGTLTPVTYP